MARSIYDRGLLRPSDIARLQRVFDATCEQRSAHPDSSEAREVALTVLALHNAGMHDEQMLLDAMAFPRLEAKAG